MEGVLWKQEDLALNPRFNINICVTWDKSFWSLCLSLRISNKGLIMTSKCVVSNKGNNTHKIPIEWKIRCMEDNLHEFSSSSPCCQLVTLLFPKHILLPSPPLIPVFVLVSANSQEALVPILPAPGSLSPLHRTDLGLDLLFHLLRKCCCHGSSDWLRDLFLLVVNHSGTNGCCFIIAFPEVLKNIL